MSEAMLLVKKSGSDVIITAEFSLTTALIGDFDHYLPLYRTCQSAGTLANLRGLDDPTLQNSHRRSTQIS